MANEHAADGRRVASSLALVGLAAALWGTGGPVAKQLFLISALDPIEVGFYRIGISAPVLFAAALLTGRRGILAAARGSHLGLIAALSLATALYQVFYYVAVANAGVTIATLITICAAPPVVGVLSGVLLGERVARRTKLAMAITIAGTALLIGWPADDARGAEGLLFGAAMAFGAAGSYAGMVLSSRRLAQHYDAFQLIVIGFGGGAMLLLPVVAVQGFAPAGEVEIVGLILFLGLIPTALAYVFFFTGMQHAPAAASSVVSLMEPLVASVLGMLIFQERIGLVGSIGAGLMIAGLLTLRAEPPPKRP
jgi:DME family drug/metabolite transporter